MLTAARIARLRATAARALPDLCDIETRSTVSDGGGGTTTTWTVLSTNVPCRISPLGGLSGGGGEQGTTGGRIADESTHIVTLTADTGLSESDRLRITGQVYEVLLVRTRGAWELTRRVECKEAP